MKAEEEIRNKKKKLREALKKESVSNVIAGELSALQWVLGERENLQKEVKEEGCRLRT